MCKFFTIFVENSQTMRRLFVFLTAIFTILTATAQVEHSIILDQSSVRKMTNSGLDNANIDPIRKDSSRNACARVKIQFANMSRAEVDALVLQFRSNTDLVRQEIGYYDNILILEMTARPDTRFYVQSPEYGQSNEVTLNLEGDTEYEMEARLNSRFSIIVESNAKGAQVYLDGVLKNRIGDNGKCTLSEVMIGVHTLKLVYGGLSEEQQIDVNKDAIFFCQNINTAASEPQFVVFVVEPQSAVVIIENQHYTLTDGAMSVVLDSGTYNYTVTAAGYHSKSGTFTVAGNKVERNIELTADAATVTLTAPADAEIWVNGVQKGVGKWRGTLNSGTYIFEARKAGHKSVKLSQHITSAQPQQSYTLPAPTPIVGSIVVSGTPITADVALDGKPVGQLPLKLGNILVGEHKVTISKVGYTSYTHTVTVSEGKSSTVNAALTKQSVPTSKPTTSSTSGSYKIGDIVTVKGVKGVKGVVFQTSPVVKIVSVEEGYTQWGEYGVTTNAIDKDNGKANMTKIKSISDWQNKYPAFKWCADYGNGWYLPALNELKAIIAQRDKINKTLSANNMDKLGSKDEYSCLWSSSEFSNNGAYYIYFSSGYDSYLNKSYNTAVRAVLELDAGTSSPKPIPSSVSTRIGGFEMVYVKGGTFTMGATAEQGSDAYDDEKPTHSVTLSDYYIGKYEVTQAQWRAVMGSNPSHFTGDNNPVEQVSWDDIQQFITKLNAQTGKKFRLPTEAEWEYAARGGNKSKGYKYSGSNNIYNVAWYSDNSSGKTHPVGQKSPNELGIYDMSGNVWEWCQDWKGDYSSSSQTNPTGPSSGSDRVLRGGCWTYRAGSSRVSYRSSSSPSFRSYTSGFRLVCSAE